MDNSALFFLLVCSCRVSSHNKKPTLDVYYRDVNTVIYELRIWMLVYVPNAVPDGSGTANLTPLGDAGDSARPHLEAGGPHFRKHKHRCP
jgi:hypothetical protein